ncbi:hypothetical protein J1605_006609 [Eschrichtius robustus]|uniref:Uncharacterized protein n=1 Tax=Eschrichtius robustus TaxID=9764 RepID=A0AB34H324_ESCRO|nr:hypothetical protein J1605_006609 [Eschrichtius robustus]
MAAGFQVRESQAPSKRKDAEAARPFEVYAENWSSTAFTFLLYAVGQNRHRAHPDSKGRPQTRLLLTPSNHVIWAFLVAQWLRIGLPMQETRVRALVWEDPTCRGATKPVSHNY